MYCIRTITWRAAARALAISALGLALTSAAQAQMTAAQQSAIRSSCRSDFMANCASVPPGGKEALACLKSHMATLSPACVSAINAAPPAAAAAPPPPAASKPAVAKTPPPPPAAPPPHKTVVTAPPAPPPPKIAVAPPPPPPSAAEQHALRRHCRRDFRRYCRGVPSGGMEALACLQRHAALLSRACGRAVRTVMAPPPAVIARPAPAAAPPIVVVPPEQPRRPVISDVVLGRACLRDLILHCRGVGFGHGQKIDCLMAYEASGHRLSLLCRTALKLTPMQ
jgi:hypothetical protein